MKARRLIEGSTFAPKTLLTLCKAFDDAWSEISRHFDGHEKLAQEARMRLAHAVLAVASEDSDDTERVKNNALQVMALGYSDRPVTDR
jgi:hypothetical protein